MADQTKQTQQSGATKKLPPYSPAETFWCPKCHYMAKRTSFCKGKVTEKEVAGKGEGTTRIEKTYSCPDEVEGEHIHLTCERCGYSTHRSPADAGMNMDMKGV